MAKTLPYNSHTFALVWATMQVLLNQKDDVINATIKK